MTPPSKNEEILPKVKEERNIIYKVKQRKAKCTDQILRPNGLLKHIFEVKREWKTEVTEEEEEDVSSY